MLGLQIMRLQRKFFNRNAEIVALELLGKKLCRRLPDGSVIRGIITETEAYLGGEDLASHSRLGLRTKRNEVMYGPSGFAYVYFTYGMHWLLNFVCGDIDDAQAVLIRAIRPVGEWASSKTDGPAKLTKQMQIDGTMNGEDIIKSPELWVEEGIQVQRSNIVLTPRIGVNYAGKWRDKPLRFLIHSNVLKNMRIVDEVYRIVKSIPRGKVMTYGAIAKKVGTSPRVVGNALHKNEEPENIPCHRVVDRNGKLAENYTFGGVSAQKRKLLAEGVVFHDNLHVNIKYLL